MFPTLKFIRRASTAPKLILYKQNASPPSCAVMMTAHILKLDLEYKEPVLLKLEHKSPEFRKNINPMGTIPVLQDENFIVSESHAIIKYLVEKYGGEHRNALYPDDVRTRAIIDERMYFDAGVFFNRLMAVSITKIIKKGLTAPPQEQLEEIDDAYSTLELYLQKSRYIAADHLTVADLSVGSTAFAIQAFLPVDSAKYPKTGEWMQRLAEESYFQTITIPGAALLKQLLDKFFARNKSRDS